MKNKILLRTNVFVCAVIVLGFIITSITSYRANMGVFETDVEHVSDLAADGIFYQIDSIFTKPVNVSLTMANDNLLKEFLAEETSRLQDDTFVKSMRDYLHAYREKYSYDSVFLVSAQTNRYYHFNGVDRIMKQDNPENVWYYEFIANDKEYSLNIDNDEAADNEITVFINCKIRDRNGAVLGVVGVGFRVDDLQDLLKEYEQEFNVKARLINPQGVVEISTQYTGYENVNLFDNPIYQELKDRIQDDRMADQTYWLDSAPGREYVVSRYIGNLDWNLIVENDTSILTKHMRQSMIRGILIICIIIIIVLFTITTVIRKYNERIIELTTAREREYYEARQEAAKQLYENIYELDITHNCPVGESTERYFESLGVPEHTPYDEALKIIAAKQIKQEHRQGYIDTFSAQNVLEVYEKGIKSLSYDFMITNDGQNYYWMRIMACIYFWSEDNSVRMTAYRQNIDQEKQQEKRLFEQMQSDPLTGIYNKAAVQELICEMISAADNSSEYAFIIVDIDDFKQVNDTYGHSAGDFVIATFARNLKKHFQEEDIVGRIGGDEFAVFLKIPNQEWLDKQAQVLSDGLRDSIMTDTGICSVSASIGIAVYPDMGADFETLYKNADFALYQTKKNGKNGYTIYNAKFNS
ncbi:sensor domain-containing diguanylate cyclase [Clostridium sp. MCC353]|uniref:sensor domain-containing diguanylate cyclase n=1 Tax=Clostridium sp. MCC353 TaxID=2592646 RepID=UPI00207A0E7B|nr:sensor domain-containing diguanylate cyclase [Clostridium sp. MCC353]